MADESATILTWSVENWVTVVLMGLIGFGLVGLAQYWYQNRQA